MPAATNKQELLQVFDKEFKTLNTTLEKVNEVTAQLSPPDDSASIKGIVSHRTHWMEMFHRWYEDGMAGREVHIPAEGYKWSQLKEYNARLYALGDTLPWAKLLSEFCGACTRLRTFIEACEDDELYTADVHAWTGKWTLGRYAEASGPSHFRSANAYIRKTLKTAAKPRKPDD